MSAITVTIGGIDYSQYVEQSTFEINQVLTRRGDTATFYLVSTTALTAILPLPRLLPVMIRDAYANAKFGGLLTDTIAHADRGPGVYVYECRCQDYSYPLTKTIGNKKYQNQTVDQIAKDLIATYVPYMTTMNVQANLPSVQYFNVNHLSLSDALDKLIRMASSVPLVWDVDANLDLHLTDTMHLTAADVSLVDTATVLAPQTRSVVGTPGLVAFWPLNDTNGTMLAAVGGSSNNGAYHGTVSQLQVGPQPATYGVQFDGSTGYASAPATALSLPGSFSLACWVWLPASPPTGQTAVFGIWPGGGNGYQAGFLANQVSSISASYSLGGLGGGANVTITSPSLTTAAWHFAAMTYDTATFKFYIDGALVSSQAFTGTQSSATDGVAVGAQLTAFGASEYFGGRVSLCAIYNVALSAGTIAAQFSTAGQLNLVGFERPTFTYEADATQLSNDVQVRGGTYVSNTHTQTWVGNGQQTSFPFDYPPDTTTTAGGSMPTVTVNSVAQTVALDTAGGFGTHQALVSLAQNSQSATLLFATAPGNGIVVVSTYVYDLPVFIERKSQASVAIFGKFQEYIADSNIKTQQAATQRASGEIAEFAWPVARIHADMDIVYVGALAAGQSVLVTCSQYGLNQVAMIVDTLRIVGIAGGYYQHQVDLVGLAPIGPPAVYLYGNTTTQYGAAQYQ